MIATLMEVQTLVHNAFSPSHLTAQNTISALTMEIMRMRQNLGVLQKLICGVCTLEIRETGDIVERTAPYLVSTKY